MAGKRWGGTWYGQRNPTSQVVWGGDPRYNPETLTGDTRYSVNGLLPVWQQPRDSYSCACKHKEILVKTIQIILLYIRG